ncbi:hypothetical protein IAT38_007798 [Cryptococcus sp. DSM 104549]
MASAPAATPSKQPNAAQAAKAAGRARHAENLRKYGTPLPILFPTPPKSKSKSLFTSYLPSVSPIAVEVPQCIGTFDPITHSVWVEDERSKNILFSRGFFGKGSLSRSEPSWRARRVDLLKGGDSLNAERIREQRRIARKQFKIDRAQAMLDAAKKAEAIISASANASGSATPSTFPDNEGEVEAGDDAEEDGDADADEPGPRAGSPTPSSATATTAGAIDPSSLTAQTFLVRPTRPDANRNRGKNAFRRRPAKAAGASAATSTAAASGEASTSQPVVQQQPVPAPAPAPEPEAEDEEDEKDPFDESLVEEMEHLQLSVEEAIFLSLGLGVLKIFDPISESYPPIGPAILSLLLTPPEPTPFPTTSTPTTSMLPDDPTLVSYVAYHHFRSLGWVVKDGVKFCCDWLLYRRGPAFSHSAFSCVIIPVYDDPQDQLTSPYGNEDWYEERVSWKWMNTIMRVNALVQKTVIAVYVTIPSRASFPESAKLEDGTLNPQKNDLASLLKRYTIREVAITRFGATRRRD